MQRRRFPGAHLCVAEGLAIGSDMTRLARAHIRRSLSERIVRGVSRLRRNKDTSNEELLRLRLSKSTRGPEESLARPCAWDVISASRLYLTAAEQHGRHQGKEDQSDDAGKVVSKR